GHARPIGRRTVVEIEANRHRVTVPVQKTISECRRTSVTRSKPQSGSNRREHDQRPRLAIWQPPFVVPPRLPKHVHASDPQTAMTRSLAPAQVLFDGDMPPAVLPPCDHYAGSEKLMLKSLSLQRELGPVFDVTLDCEDGAAIGHEARHAELVASLLGS